MVVFPATPLFVVIKITPLAALEPYIACAAASFKTSIEAISLGFKSLIAPILTPSAIIIGPLPPFSEL